MQTALAQAERVRKGVTLGTENGSTRPRRAFEIRWGSDLIQKARDLQDAQNKVGTEGPRQREGAPEGRGRDHRHALGGEPRLAPPDSERGQLESSSDCRCKNDSKSTQAHLSDKMEIITAYSSRSCGDDVNIM